jgi:hypothetical protein
MFSPAVNGSIKRQEASGDMISPVVSSAINPIPLTTTKPSVTSLIYEIACAIFRVIAMALQYIIVGASVIFRHIGLFPSALPLDHIRVSSRNIANLEILPKCLATAWQPESKEIYQEIGREQGLRVTYDLILRPASGICLGKSVTFLSAFVFGEEEDFKANLITAAQAVQGKENEASVRVQAIYDTLLGVQGTLSHEERNFFFQVLQGKNLALQAPFNQPLFETLQNFLSLDENPEELRQFVLKELENQEVEVTPALYRLILELDTLWFLQHHPHERKNDSAHHAIIQAVARYLQLEMTVSTCLNGKISEVLQQLDEYELGSYLIQFSNHSIACVKGADFLALFDPNEGLALFSSSDQEDALLQLLTYYGSDDRIAFRVIEIQSINFNKQDNLKHDSFH